MPITTDSLKRSLADGAAAAAKASAAGAKIVDAAGERRVQIDARLNELRPKTLTDPQAAIEYSGLVEERGRLDLVAGAR